MLTISVNQIDGSTYLLDKMFKQGKMPYYLCANIDSMDIFRKNWNFVLFIHLKRTNLLSKTQFYD